MNTLVVGFVLISAIMHACRDFLTKKANDKQIFAWWFQLFSLMFFLPVFSYFFLTEGIKNLAGLYISIISGFIIAIQWYLITKTYEHGDLSYAFPIIRSHPALVLIFSVVFLGEQISPLGFAGIVLIVLGAYTINIEKISFSEIFKPFRLASGSKAFQYALLTLLTLSFIPIIDKIGISNMHPLMYLFFIYLFSFIFFTPYILISKNRKAIKSEWAKNKKSILLNGFLAIFGYSLILFAITIENVSYVIGLRQLSIIFAILLGVYALKEKYSGIRMSASLFILTGAFLISIAQ